MRKALCYPALVLLSLLPAQAFAQQPDSLHIIEDGVRYPAWGADFGARFDEGTSVGPRRGATAEPLSACEPLQNPDRVEDNIVFIFGGECSYVTKVQHASAVGALAVVVIGDDQEHPDSLVVMEGECGPANGCTAPAAFLSYNSGIAMLKTTFDPAFTIVPIRIASPVAAEDGAPDGGYALAPAYPNPSSSGTVIRFELPSAHRARLAVYDVQGREVKVLADGVRQAGAHAVTLDDLSLPSGVYLVRLEAGRTRLAQRVTLIR